MKYAVIVLEDIRILLSQQIIIYYCVIIIVMCNDVCNISVLLLELLLVLDGVGYRSIVLYVR